MQSKRIFSSFRDPSGFLFQKQNNLYRYIDKSYSQEYAFLMQSGLYNQLISEALLVSHEEVSKTKQYIRPSLIPFVSYPYEWSFSQFKEAALATLKIQKIALSYGMTLKDASAYNVQFLGYQPVLIDTLSFEMYEEGKPWTAYKQLCEHFLAPLALMCYKDTRLSKLFIPYHEGIPLDLTSSLLRLRTYTNLSLLLHIHLHGKFQGIHFSKESSLVKTRTLSKKSLLSLIESLTDLITSLKLTANKGAWQHYYEKNSYTEKEMLKKQQFVTQVVKQLKPKKVYDLGANTGTFSEIASLHSEYVVSLDYDHACINTMYLKAKKAKNRKLLPLWIDLTNPSPAIGWELNERQSFLERGKADLIFALALIHHLVIAHNIPLSYLAKFFELLGGDLVIEYIPKKDQQIKKMLSFRKDIFSEYSEKNFEENFQKYFYIEKKQYINKNGRVLYYMKRKIRK